MTHLSKRPVALLTILQLLTVLVAGFGTLIAGFLGILAWTGLTEIILGVSSTAAASGLTLIKVFVVGGLATVVAVSACCYIALWNFLTLLQRMKKETAFTQRNCQALGRMALCCAVAAAILFVMMSYTAVGVFVPTRSFTRDVWEYVHSVCTLMIWPFGFGLVALLIQGVRVLMARAIALREEQELVV